MSTQTHQIAVMVLGFLLVIGAPIAWKKFQLDGFLAWVAFFIGVALVVDGKL